MKQELDDNTRAAVVESLNIRPVSCFILTTDRLMSRSNIILAARSGPASHLR